MNQSSNSLTFDLVKTLEPTEKAYIKKQFSANEKNLKQLFDDLNKTKVYNTETFKAKHKTKAYINHLSQNKTYLRRKILNALIQYNAKSIPEINQRYELNVVSVLIHQGLLGQAIKLIEQGLQKNEQFERYLRCYELCSLITNLSVDSVRFDIPKNTLTLFKQKQHFYIKQLSLIEKFAEFTDIHYAQLSNKEKAIALEEKLTKFNLNKLEELPKNYPFITKRMFFFTKNRIAELQNNARTTLHLLEKCVNLHFEYPHFLQNNYTPFLTDSLNFLNSLNLEHLFDIFFDMHKKILDKIEEINSSNKIKNDFTTSYFVIKYYFHQLACNKSEQYQKAYSFSKEYSQFLISQKNLSDQFLSASRVSIAAAHLNVQQFEDAIEIINPIQNTKFYQYQYELRLIQIIAHYRLGNDLVLDSLFTSFIYYLKKQEKPEQTKAIRTLKKCLEKQNFEALQKVEFDELLSLNVQFALTTNLIPE